MQEPQVERNLTLDDGSQLVLRPIRPGDAAIEDAFVADLSPETRRRRFMSSLRGLTPAMLAHFTHIDDDREMALIATHEEGGREREVGVCRYSRMPDGESCEYAIVLADAWQGRGLGLRMMQALIGIARGRAIKRMVGWVLASNHEMLELCADLGFAIAADLDDSTMRCVTLQLQYERRTAAL